MGPLAAKTVEALKPAREARLHWLGSCMLASVGRMVEIYYRLVLSLGLVFLLPSLATTVEG